MLPRELEELESFDLTTLSISDLAGLKNDVLRRSLIAALEASAGPIHTNHWAFQSHLMAMAHEATSRPLRSQEG